jgi:drug/metabolite transporter (DMT)-like permease
MGILFSILSPAIFAMTNYIDKFLLEKHNISSTVITIYGGIFAFFTGLIILFATGFYPIDTKSLLIILSSGFLTSIYLLPYYKALSIDETSNVIPLYQFYPVFVLILSFIFFKEGFSIAQYIGSALIVGAGFILSAENLGGKIFKLRKSFFYIIISSILFAIAQVLYKFGVTQIPFWNTLPYEGFGIALGALAITVYKNNFKKFKKETNKFKKRIFLLMSINELVYVLARYAGYFAISLISVGIVSILGSFQPLFVLIFGIILSVWFPYIIKEVVTRKTIGLKLAAIIIIIIGSYFIFV